MKEILFGITGFGNVVLEELISKNCKPKLIITRKEIGPDPYLNMIQLTNLAKKFRIPVMFDKSHLSEKFDLCIVATYHKLIDLNQSDFNLAYNIHPSLLPKYKGKDPISDVIRKKENFTGVTVHQLTNQFDQGKIIFQKKLKIINHEKKQIIKQMIPIFRLFTKKIISEFNNKS